MRYSYEESVKSGLRVLDTEHLLLGLMREATESRQSENQGVAYRVLINVGIDLDKLHQDLLALIDARVAATCTFTQSSMDLENVSPEGKTLFATAQKEARQLGHKFVGTEQLLVGIVAQDEGIAAKTLSEFGLNLERCRLEVEKIVGQGSGGIAAEIPLTPRARRVMELSRSEANTIGHNQIGAEDLLLGIIREGGGVAAQVFCNTGLDAERVRERLLEKMGNET